MAGEIEHGGGGGDAGNETQHAGNEECVAIGVPVACNSFPLCSWMGRVPLGCAP
jgi:hypothetical protein